MFSFMKVVMLMVSLYVNRNPNYDRSWYQKWGLMVYPSRNMGDSRVVMRVIWTVKACLKILQRRKI